MRPFTRVVLSVVLISPAVFAASAEKSATVTAPGSTAVVAAAPSSIVPSDFPYTLQSVFGREGGALSAGLRDKDSGRSLWVSPGEKVGAYTLRSVDTKTGAAEFAKGARTFRIRLSGATPGAAPGARKAVDPVENLKLEKGLLNSSRQISSAANQYFSEHAVREAEFGKLRQFFSKDTFPPGTKIEVRSGGSVQVVDIADKAADSLVLKSGDTFALHQEGYDKSASETNLNRNYPQEALKASESSGGDSGFVFSVDSATVQK